MNKMNMPESKREKVRKELYRTETEYIRSRRIGLTQKAFESLAVIGRGGFGEVHLVRMKGTQDLFAMKKLKKSEMIRRGEIANARAERDALAESNKNAWVVTLHFSFQDKDYLYLIMEYVPGGDMMNLLMKLDIFTEEMTRIYIAETVLAIDSIHKMGFIHRDIKPDNLLLDARGHIKLTDFGLCTGYLTKEISSRYEKLMHKDKEKNIPAKASKEKINTWKRNRRIRAYSKVGTPDYMAPEVVTQSGYTKECDFWSVGTIMFEMLCGYAPFCSDDYNETYWKIINWKDTLQFPDDVVVSNEAQDLIRKLCCEERNRMTVEEIKQHPFFKGLDWDHIRDGPGPYIPPIEYPEDIQNFPVEPSNKPLHKDGGEEVRPSVRKVVGSNDIPFIGYTFKKWGPNKGGDPFGLLSGYDEDK